MNDLRLQTTTRRILVATFWFGVSMAAFSTLERSPVMVAAGIISLALALMTLAERLTTTVLAWICLLLAVAALGVVIWSGYSGRW